MIFVTHDHLVILFFELLMHLIYFEKLNVSARLLNLCRVIVVVAVWAAAGEIFLLVRLLLFIIIRRKLATFLLFAFQLLHVDFVEGLQVWCVSLRVIRVDQVEVLLFYYHW